MKEQAIKQFKTMEEMKEYGKDFSSHEHQTVELNGEKKILCGTDRAYEEEIWSSVNEILMNMCAAFGMQELAEDREADNIVDESSKLRDDIIEWFEKSFDVEFVNVYDEY